MRANELRHRIDIQVRSTGRDAQNRPLDTWSTVASPRAKIVPLSGRERFSGNAGRTDISHLVTIRYQAQFSSPQSMAGMRFLYAGRIFNITSSRDVDERHFDIELTASEGMNDG